MCVIRFMCVFCVCICVCVCHCVCVSVCLHGMHSAMSLLLFVHLVHLHRKLCINTGYHLCLSPSSLKIMIIITLIITIINIGFVFNFGVCPLTLNKYISLFATEAKELVSVLVVYSYCCCCLFLSLLLVSLREKGTDRLTNRQRKSASVRVCMYERERESLTKKIAGKRIKM